MHRAELHPLDPGSDCARGCRLQVEVGSPWFAGHFPGRPILPAVAQLAVVMQAERFCSGIERTPAEFASLRFLDRVGPGSDLQLRLGEPDRDGRASFALGCGLSRISRGSVRWRDAVAQRGASQNLTDDDPGWAWDGGVDAEPLLPHAEPARLIVAVRSGAADRLDGLARIPANSPFVTAGTAPALIALEIAAQAAAALEALGRATRSTGSVGSIDTRGIARQGYLVSAKQVSLATDTIPADTAVRVHLRLSGQALPLSLYSFRVAVGGLEQAAGVVGTYLAET